MVQIVLEFKVERAVKLGDNLRAILIKAELASILNKKDQALVVTTRLKRMFYEATHMTVDRCAEFRNASL